jgi:hypothetical protein
MGAIFEAVHLNGPPEAHNEWEHASHRQIAHLRTTATEHRERQRWTTRARCSRPSSTSPGRGAAWSHAHGSSSG